MIFYITACDKRKKYAEQVSKIFKKQNFEYVFVYGINNKEKIEPFIEVDSEETYENLPLKTYYIIDHFLKKTNHNKFIKINDDTYINFNKFKDLNLEEDYIGGFVNYPTTIKSEIFHWFKIMCSDYKVKQKTFDINYAEGSFYVLSRKAAEYVYAKEKEFFINSPETYLGEDIKVAMALKGKEISIKNIASHGVPFYEILQNYTVIHPTHFLLFQKLENCKSDEEVEFVLNNAKILNDNIQREIFLQKEIKKNNYA